MLKTKLMLAICILSTTLRICLWGSLQEENTQGIPKVAHFVYGLWDTKPMSSIFSSTIDSWREQGWAVKLWNKADVEALLNLPEYNSYKATYISLSRNIQKADFIRYLIVMHEGGFYFDLDCKPSAAPLLQHLKSLPMNVSNVFFIETVTSPEFAKETANIYPIRKEAPQCCERISNFAFGSKKGSVVLAAILKLAAERCRDNPVITSDYDVLYTTGPDCVTEAVGTISSEVYKIHNTYDFVIHVATGTWRDNHDVGTITPIN